MDADKLYAGFTPRSAKVLCAWLSDTDGIEAALPSGFNNNITGVCSLVAFALSNESLGSLAWTVTKPGGNLPKYYILRNVLSVLIGVPRTRSPTCLATVPQLLL